MTQLIFPSLRQREQNGHVIASWKEEDKGHHADEPIVIFKAELNLP